MKSAALHICSSVDRWLILSFFFIRIIHPVEQKGKHKYHSECFILSFVSYIQKFRDPLLPDDHSFSELISPAAAAATSKGKDPALIRHWL